MERILKALGVIAFFTLVILLCNYGCESKKSYDKNHGEPKYKVTLLDNFGNPIETRYAHEKYESWDWGVHKNYEFRYHRWNYQGDSKERGITSLETWEWNKQFVKIVRLR
jgi:hypothetical protein